MKPQQLADLLKVTIPAGLPLLVKGAPGTGKSDIIAQACTATGAELIIEHPVVSDPTDYKGLPFAQDGHADFLPFGSLRRLINATTRTVFFMDDIGQAPASVQAALMQLLLARRVNGNKVSDLVTFLGATNRHTDRAGVTGLLEPVKSRFCSIVELEPDVNDWVSWALTANLPIELIAFIRFRPSLLWDFKPTNALVNTPCPRTVANVGRLMSIGLPPGLEYEVFSGACGEGFAAEFMAFLQIFRTLPNIDQILLTPDKALVPDDPATLYAVCGALSRKASDQTMDRITVYADRLPDEFSVLLVRDCTVKTPSVVNTRAFIAWSSKHSDVLI